ncbi:hypothetical protein GGF32_008235 [Allomyces javanicus]|nr:hypothetical protein GGF32_008235 [Allomyces javanicus]
MPPADVAVMPPPQPLPDAPVQRQQPLSPPRRPTRPPVEGPTNCLWVGNLTCDVFEDFGVLDDVHVVRDPHTRRSKGFAFVSYKSPEHADRAHRFVTETQLAILNRQVRIKRSAPRPPRNGPGAGNARGGFGGRGGRGGGRGGGPGGMCGGRGGGPFRGGPPRPMGERNHHDDRHSESHRSGYDDRRSDRDYPNDRRSDRDYPSDRHGGSSRLGYDDDRKRHASYDDRDRDRQSRDSGHDSRRQDEHRRHHSYDDRDRSRHGSHDGGSGRDYRDRDRERSPRRDYR